MTRKQDQAEGRVTAALAAAGEQSALNAFVRLHDRESLLREAARAKGPLAGLPLAVKDNIDEAGTICSAGCKAYADRVPENDAEVVRRLKQAGAVPIGRTNMHELADGVTSENEHYGPVHNPHRRGFHPGGSSGGSAAAVAAGIVPVALGTDTGGSVRIPASLCGVVGFKPTTGAVPIDGVMPLSTTLDHLGPIAGSVADAARVFAIMAGMDPIDLVSSLSDLRIGVLEGFGQEADGEVSGLFESAVQTLEKTGCSLVSIRIPDLSNAMKILSRIYTPEAARIHAERLEQAPGDFSEEIRQDLERGLSIDPGKHKSALEKMVRFRTMVEQASENVDLLACPTTPHPAKPFGSKNPHTYLAFTCPFNLTGQPAISLPMGKVGGLPVGLQLVGKRGGDEKLLVFANRIADGFGT